MNAHENRQILSLELNEQTLPAIEQITDGMPGGFLYTTQTEMRN